MSETTDTLATGELFDSCGQEWRLSPITPDIRGEFSAWCKKRARQLITESRADLTPEEYEEDLERFVAARNAGHYNWGSPHDRKGLGKAVHAILQGAEGQATLIGILLREKHGKLPPERVAAIMAGADPDELADALRQVSDFAGPNGSRPTKSRPAAVPAAPTTPG